VPDPYTKFALFAFMAMGAAIMVNRTIAVYHDGFRTTVMSLWSGEKTREELARYSYTIGVGFIVAYALPFALATGIIMIHMIMLGCDVIGIRFERTRTAAAVGFAYGLFVSVGVHVAASGIHDLDVVPPGIELLWMPLAYAIPLLGVVAAARQFGMRWGIAVAVITLAIWHVAKALLDAGGHEASSTFTASLIALAAVTAGHLVVASRQRGETEVNLDMFADKIQRVRRNWPWLLAMAASISVAASQGWLGGEPLQVVMVDLDEYHLAAAIAVFSVIGYLPVQGMTGLVSGVWNQDGYPDWFLAVGFVVRNPIGAAVCGAALMAVELLSLRRVAWILTRRPGVTEFGHAARDAMEIVPTFALLAGATSAAIAAGGPSGAFVVVGTYALNEMKGRPVPPVAVSVIAYLGVAIFVGVAHAIGLY
jgi:hypothetical protein